MVSNHYIFPWLLMFAIMWTYTVGPQWIKVSLNSLYRWLYVRVRTCLLQPLIKCNYRAESLIIRLRLTSSFPVGFVGLWAEGVTVTAVCQCGLWRVTVAVRCLVYSKFTCLYTHQPCQPVGGDCGQTPLLFFTGNICIHGCQEHSNVSEFTGEIFAAASYA